MTAPGEPASIATEPRGTARGARGPLDPRAVLTSIGEVVYDWDLATDAISWSANAAEVLGLADMAALSTGAAFGLACEDAGGRTRHDAVLDAAEADEGAGVAFCARYALRLPAGSRRGSGCGLVLLEDTGRWYAGADGRPAFAHGAIRVANAARETPAAARGRVAFLDAIRADVAEAARARRPMTLIVAAIENLDRIDAEHGFEAADAVVEEAARRAAGVMRRRDKFARYASNRIGVALLSCAPEQAGVAAQRLRESVETLPVETPQGPLSITIAVGAASAPVHAGEAPLLLRRAEEALAASRRAGVGFQAYRPGLAREGARAGCRRELDVVAALNERRLVLARQPIVEARSRRPAFGEALARIREEDGRIRGAGDIVPAVERAGFAPLLDGRMLELATAWLVDNPAERLSLNLSPQTLDSPDWLGGLAARLGAAPGVAERLVLEVTETVAVRDPEATRGRLDAMKALGVAIALDDFGAGHTSFRHLRSFPVDILKIDGVFVQNLARSPDDRFFVRTLVDLAHHLGVLTVAEWVEDLEAADMLAEWGVDYLQGDAFGKPELVEAPPAAAAGRVAAA